MKEGIRQPLLSRQSRLTGSKWSEKKQRPYKSQREARYKPCQRVGYYSLPVTFVLSQRARNREARETRKERGGNLGRQCRAIFQPD